MPMTFFALGLGGLSLMGLPPSGGFAAKWLLIMASIESGQWLWAVVMLIGGLLAAGYLYRVLQPALADVAVELKAQPKRSREAIALGLAIVAVALAFLPAVVLQLHRARAADPRGQRPMTGNALIVAALAAPLVLFAMLFPRGLRPAATAVRWLAPFRRFSRPACASDRTLQASRRRRCG